MYLAYLHVHMYMLPSFTAISQLKSELLKAFRFLLLFRYIYKSIALLTKYSETDTRDLQAESRWNG